jgi:hypothetical protein
MRYRWPPWDFLDEELKIPDGVSITQIALNVSVGCEVLSRRDTAYTE